MNGALWIPVVLGGLVGLWVIAIWNRFVRLGQHLRESWSDMALTWRCDRPEAITM